MARTRRIRRDGDAHYHLMSRTNDRRFLFSKGRCGMDAVVDVALDGWRARMHDVSQFAKTFKELVSISYKAFLRTSAESDKQNYCGSIWSGRFKSTLVEGGRYLATCVRYVELNPVRAGMVSQARDYAYSSANEPKPNEINVLAGCVPDAAQMLLELE